MVYFPGGKTEYLNTVRKFLNFVDQNCPTEEEVEKWFASTFHSTNTALINRCIDTLKKIQLISKEENKFELTALAEKSSDPQFIDLIFKALDTCYLGISETLDVLCKKSPLPLSEIIESLRKVDIEWDTKTQYNIRLNWLLSLGYAVQNGPLYEITDAGRKAKIGVSENEDSPSHDALKAALVATGENWGFRSFSEYVMDSNRLDVVWFPKNETIPRFAAEIQLNEQDLEKALTRLAYAHSKHIDFLGLYTKKELIPKALRILNEIYPELADVLSVDPWSKINKEKVASEMHKLHFRDKFRDKPYLKFRKFPPKGRLTN